MKVINLIFALLFLAFSLVSAYLYFKLHAPHFALFGVSSLAISYFLTKELLLRPKAI